VLQIHRSQPPGDILVFLTGQAEIDHCCELLRSEATEVHGRNDLALAVCPLYAGLPADRQMRAFASAPSSERKVVVSTNIAEASVTLPGVVYVVDCGFVKERVYRARSGTDALLIVPIAKASAVQRAGRAGRVRPGKCYRLYTERAFASLREQAVPEMQRCNLTTMLLQLKALGVDDVLHFPFLSPPPAETMIRGLELLFALGALDDDCRLTSPLGTTMAEFPLDPCLTKMLLAAGSTGCAEEVLSIAAVLSVQTVFQYAREARGSADLARRRFAVAEGDHLTLLNVFNCFQKQRQSKVRGWCKANYLNYGALRRALEIRAQLKVSSQCVYLYMCVCVCVCVCVCEVCTSSVV
jgi:ATP-dependent RNA helicase DDX35